MASTSGLTYRHSRSCPGANGTTCCAGSWRAVVCIPGSRDQLRETFHSYSEARRWKAATQAAVDEGKIATTPSQQPKLRQAAETFLAGARAGVILTSSEERYKPATLRSYERALRLRVLPALGDKRLGKITRADVQRLVNQWRAQGLQGSTVRNSLDPLRVVLRGAMEDGLIAVDPMRGLRGLGKSGRRERVASPPEAARLLAALPESERALWATALYAGLRRGELRGLCWDDVDLGRGRIRVARSWDDVEGEQRPKTLAGARSARMMAVLRPILQAHQMQTGGRGGDLVFGREADKPFVSSTVRARALKAWKAAGLTPITLHECRHTYASMLSAAGENQLVVMASMGHSDIATTLRIYAKEFDAAGASLSRTDAWHAEQQERPALRAV